MPMSIWGTRILSKRNGKYFNAKAPSASISYPAIPCWKWFWIKEKCPLYIHPRTRCLSKKLAANLRVFRLLRTRCAPWWTAMHMKIQSTSVYLSSANKLLFFRSQSGNRPAPTCKAACRSSIIFTSIIRFASKTHYVSGRCMFSLWRRFSSCSSNHSLASDIHSNQGLLLFWKLAIVSSVTMFRRW